jgi:predicted membrane channel-forming protein YqfA (hemolysin III family)
MNISNKQRASFVGILILLAYSMLTYTITNNKMFGVITDIISGLAVIGIPLLMFPIFSTTMNKTLN